MENESAIIPRSGGGQLLTFALTLSKEGGLTIEKHIRKTSVCGYESGRSRS